MHPMLTFRMKCLPLILAFLLTSAFGKPPEDIQDKLDVFANDNPGGIAVAWVDADGVTFFSGGRFSLNDDRPITPDTQFEIGSITKVFTALLLVESERQGKVSRFDPVGKYLLSADDPDQEKLAKITLHALTTHSAGLLKMPFNSWNYSAGHGSSSERYDREAMIKALRFSGPSAPVGRAWAYSNFGLAMLGEALAEAWGESYEAILRAHVLTPLGMNRTTLAISGRASPDNLAPGHHDGNRVGVWRALAMAPAGALRSSARDMSILLQAALGGKDAPLQQAFIETTTPQREAVAMGGQMGMGWLISGSETDPIPWHNGGTAGHRSFMGFSRDRGLGVVVLTNHRINLDKFGFNLLGVKRPRPTGMVVKDAQSYVGKYRASGAENVKISEQKSMLYASFSKEGKRILRKISGDRYAVLNVPAEIVFERDAAGKVVSLVYNLNGEDTRVKKRD